MLTTVIAPSQRALAREDPSDGRESAMSEADSTSVTLTPDRDIWLLLESESDEDDDGVHDAVISYPVPDRVEASQYITLFTCPPGAMVAVLLSTVTPLTLRVTFPSAVDPP